MLTSIIESELCCHKIKSHNRMRRNPDILQNERWQPTQCHAGGDCTQAMHLPLGAVAPVQQFTFLYSFFLCILRLLKFITPQQLIFSLGVIDSEPRDI